MKSVPRTSNVTEDSVRLECDAVSLGGQIATVLRTVTFHHHAQYQSRRGLTDPEDEGDITFEQQGTTYTTTQQNNAEALNLQYEHFSARAKKQTLKIRSPLRVLHRPNCPDC